MSERIIVSKTGYGKTAKFYEDLIKEIIEEDKKIEEIDMFDYFTGYDYGGTNKKLLTDLEYNFVKLNSKINEIIDYINKEK